VLEENEAGFPYRAHRASGRSAGGLTSPIHLAGTRSGEDAPFLVRAGRSAGSPSHSLPPRPTSIIGREQDLALAVRLLLDRDTRLLTMVGPPGVGKTRLAIEMAATVLDGSAIPDARPSTATAQTFADGAWFVDLAPVGDHRQVADAAARGLGLGGVGGRAAADVLEDFLRDKSLLMILDNFEQVLDAADLVARLLAACPKLKILATSRAPLHLRWEHELPVQPLALPDLHGSTSTTALTESPAVQLFVERARTVAPAFALGDAEAAAVAEICLHLDGLPLAIELAAARIKLFSPAALVRRLTGADDSGMANASPLHLLSGRTRDVPARQQTLWSAITWSYDVLEPDEQALLRRLAVFVGGCTLDLVDSLVDKSLVARSQQPDGEPRLRLLETIREFGLEQLRAGGELEAVRRQHAEYYLALAERAAPELSGPDQAAWLDRLEPERANLLRVLEWSAERDRVDTGLRLGAALWPFWLVRGQAREARGRLLGLLTAGRDRAASQVRAAALVGVAILSRHAGDYVTSRALLGEALEVGRALEDQGSIAHALHHLGWLAYLEGDLEEAWSLGDRSLTMFRQLGDRAGAADVLHGLGFVAHLRNDYPTARAQYEESLALQREVGNPRGVALALHNLGLADALLRGDLAAARRQYDESLQSFRELGDRQSIAMALGNLGDVAMMQRDYAAAQVLHRECLVTASEVDDRRRIAFSLAGVAMLAAARGEAARASRLAAAATALREAIGAAPDRAWQARLEPGLAATRAKLGRQAGARAWAEGAAMTPGEAVTYALGAARFDDDHHEASPADPLTTREQDVVQLIVRGLANRQIADTLVITEGTAANYVQRILSKLGFNSRAQIAAWAVEHGLGPSSDHS